MIQNKIASHLPDWEETDDPLKNIYMTFNELFTSVKSY